jgi:elongation factor P--(R)-beta-lysine ligase
VTTSQIREKYLQDQWEKYPDAMPFKHAGRISEIGKSSLTLFVGWKPKGSSLKKVPVKSIKNWSQIKPVLILGDIIAISKKQELVLLTPWKSESKSELPQETIKKLSIQSDWNQFLNLINRFFAQKKFLSVQTPTLVSNPGPEPTIDAFKTVLKNGRSKTDKYLITSPELHLKKIVAQTLTPVYEITKVYRNNESSPKHQPEFWMLEWYRPFADLSTIVKDVQELILFLNKSLSLKQKKLSFVHTTFQKILKDEYSFEFSADTTAETLKQWLSQRKIHFSEAFGIDDLFTLINIEMIETKLDPKKITFLSQYPPYAAALAKLDKNGWAQRFEVYWQDLELGNAFNELNDSNVQQQRLIEDNEKKKQNGLEPLPPDLEFIESLKKGLPPTAGISIGLERLFMALHNQTNINVLKWFA